MALTIQELKECILNEMTIHEIAEKFNVSCQTVTNRIKWETECTSFREYRLKITGCKYSHKTKERKRLSSIKAGCSAPTKVICKETLEEIISKGGDSVKACNALNVSSTTLTKFIRRTYGADYNFFKLKRHLLKGDVMKLLKEQFNVEQVATKLSKSNAYILKIIRGDESLLDLYRALPNCRSDVYMQRPGILYVLEIKGKGETFFKVGITSRNVYLRYRNSALNDNYSYKIIHQHKGVLCDLYKHEQTIIKESSSYTPKFKFDGYSECMSELPKL